MRYHQTNQTKHDHRITVLAKVEDKYDWSGITFPVSVDQIETFEEHNKLTMNIWEIGEDEKTYLTRQGNVLHCQSGMVNLLLIENEEGQAHYIYIKKLEILPLLYENRQVLRRNF